MDVANILRSKVKSSISNGSPFKEWCEFKTVLSTKGRNGKILLVFLKDRPEDKIVCKLSRMIDFSVRHEYNVMEALHTLKCPNFPVPYGLVTTTIDCNYRRKINPFSISKELYPIETDILLMEHIEGTDLEKFSRINKSYGTIFPLVKQVMLAVLVAQESLKFTHYDLHPANVIVKTTDLQRVEYTIKGKKYSIATNGYLAIIIDFGLSYVNTFDHMYCPLYHTDVGVLSNKFKQFADFKQLLLGVNTDIEHKKLERFVEKMFGKLDIDWEHGWDITDECNAIEHVISTVYDKSRAVSRVFSEYGYICVSLVQTIIRYKTEYEKGIKESYSVLEREFLEIEKQVGSVFYCLYILRCMVDVARELYDEYICDSSRETAVKKFKSNICEKVDKITKFCTLSSVNWNRLLCALYAFSIYTWGEINEHIKKQDIKYNIPVKNDIELYNKFCDEMLR